MSSIENGRARAVADLAEGLILASVEIAAPPERVFRALVSKEVCEWWGRPGVFDTREWTGDARVGGRWREAHNAAEILRLADVARLRGLEARAEVLWPATPRNVPAMRAWLAVGERRAWTPNALTSSRASSSRSIRRENSCTPGTALGHQAPRRR